MNEVTITPEMERMAHSAADTFDATTDIKISNQENYEIEAIRVKGVKARHKETKATRDDLLKPFKEGMAKLTAFFKTPLDRLKDAEDNIKSAMLVYSEKIEKEQAEEQKKLDDAAEKERLRLEKLAEKQESKGNVEKAEETREKAVSVPTHTFTPRPKPKGVAKRDSWQFRIIDASKIPREYLVPDEKKLGAIARAGKGTIKIEGVVFENKPIIAVSR